MAFSAFDNYIFNGMHNFTDTRIKLWGGDDVGFIHQQLWQVWYNITALKTLKVTTPSSPDIILLIWLQVLLLLIIFLKFALSSSIKVWPLVSTNARPLREQPGQWLLFLSQQHKESLQMESKNKVRKRIIIKNSLSCEYENCSAYCSFT